VIPGSNASYRGRIVMRENEVGDLADCAVYPLLIAVMILVIGDGANALGRLVALAIAFGCALLWTRVTWRLERIALHGTTPGAGRQDQPDAGMRARLWSRAWLGAGVFASAAMLLQALGAPLVISMGIAGGLVAGLRWQGALRRAILGGKPRLATQALASHPTWSRQ
jgi:hypothetical protein